MVNVQVLVLLTVLFQNQTVVLINVILVKIKLMSVPSVLMLQEKTYLIACVKILSMMMVKIMSVNLANTLA